MQCFTGVYLKINIAWDYCCKGQYLEITIACWIILSEIHIDDIFYVAMLNYMYLQYVVRTLLKRQKHHDDLSKYLNNSNSEKISRKFKA